MKSWEQEKAYCTKRANELTAEMEAATETADRERFERAYQTAQRYMTKKQLKPLYIGFIRKAVQR